MRKKIACLLVCLGVLLPIGARTAPLNKYSLPSREKELAAPAADAPAAAAVAPEVFETFRLKVRSYGAAQKAKLKEDFAQKAKSARDAKDMQAAEYYERLIGIIESSR